MKIFLSFDNSITQGGGQSILRYVQSHSKEKGLVVFCPPGSLASQCEEFADVYTFNLRDSLFVKARKLRRIFNKLPESSEINAHGISTMPLVFISTFGIKIKKTFTEHLLTKEYKLDNWFRGFIQSIVYFFLLRNFSHVYCVSEAVQLNLNSKFLYPKSRTSVMYNTIPILRDSPKKHSRMRNIKLITVGSITRLKNHKFLLEVMKELPSTYSLDIYGEGPLRKHLTKILIDRGLEERVTFYGSVSHDEVVARISEADIYVHSSKTESFGYTIAEAMAVGLPVVAFNVGGIPELVIDEKTGYLVELNDVNTYVQNILRLGVNPALRNELGSKGFRALDKFPRSK